ncbi:MAG TPA: UDP-N-acetylmuramoyl-tripeptide--D-alanyl-D-alanine ligase [Tenericutes bacterium]|nr:UDP-N-acetylmuramoyl-tripeptide--D-alanyl-D-alanine ligase [Mycoplasmatota bacterium]
MIINGEYNSEFKINKIKIDSRKIKNGDLFIAIKGKFKDGHNYINEAIEKGAAVVIVEEDISFVNTITIKVNDTKKALLALATLIRNKNINIPLIAITGSVGKTTTKELMYEILSSSYNVLKNEGNLNNHLGLPMTLLGYNNEDVIITEIGMNHTGEVNNLSNCCKPDISIITNIGSSHIGNLGSKKNILKAKLEIIEGMNEGVLILNGDDRLLKKINYINTNHIDVLKIGTKGELDFKAYNIKTYFDKTKFEIDYAGNKYEFMFNIGGKHLLNNVLIAIYIGLLFDIDIQKIKEVVNNFKPVKSRMNIILKNNNLIIDDCYNSSYESLKGVLKQIQLNKKHKILIIGDILELGKFSKKIHKKIGKILKRIKDKEVYLIGDNISCIKSKKYNHFNNVDDFIKYSENIKFENSLILLKASRSIGLDKVKEHLLNNVFNNVDF